MHEYPKLVSMEDTWTGHDSDMSVVHIGKGGVPTKWTGETWFEQVAPQHPDKKFVFILGQLVRQTSTTTRPSDVLPVTWWAQSTAQKKEQIKFSNERLKRLAQARSARTIELKPAPFEDCRDRGFILEPMRINSNIAVDTNAGDGGVNSECESEEADPDATCRHCNKYLYKQYNSCKFVDHTFGPAETGFPLFRTNNDLCPFHGRAVPSLKETVPCLPLRCGPGEIKEPHREKEPGDRSTHNY